MFQLPFLEKLNMFLKVHPKVNLKQISQRLCFRNVTFPKETRYSTERKMACDLISALGNRLDGEKVGSTYPLKTPETAGVHSRHPLAWSAKR